MLYWILVVIMGCIDQEKDLNTLKQLNPMAIMAIKQWSPVEDKLELNGLTSITVEEAAILASWHPSNNLIKLSDEMVQRLIPTNEEYLEAKGDLLSMQLLEYVDTPRISVAGTYPKLELNGLTTLTPEVAQEFAKAILPLEILLNGIRTIDVETMHELASGSNYGRLYLDGLETISPAVAAEMEWLYGRGFTGVYLSLRGVKEWPVESIVALQAWFGERLTLKPDVLTVEQAKAMLDLQVRLLEIENLSCMTPEIIDILKEAPFVINILESKTSMTGYEVRQKIYTIRNGAVEKYDKHGLTIEKVIK
jgi:hypothetical protein